MSSLLPPGCSTCFALKVPTATLLPCLHDCSQCWLWNTCSKPYTKRESLPIARVTVEMTPDNPCYTFSLTLICHHSFFSLLSFFFLSLGKSWCLFCQVFFSSITQLLCPVVLSLSFFPESKFLPAVFFIQHLRLPHLHNLAIRILYI